MAEPSTTADSFSVAANGRKTVSFSPMEKAAIERDARTAHLAHMAKDMRLGK